MIFKKDNTIFSPTDCQTNLCNSIIQHLGTQRASKKNMEQKTKGTNISTNTCVRPGEATSSDWFKSFLEPKSPDEPPPGYRGGKKSDDVADDVKSDEVGKGQGKSDEGKSDGGKGQGKSDEAKSHGGKGQGKSDKGKSEPDHRKSGYWSNLSMARGPEMGRIPCPVMLLGAKLSSGIVTAWVMKINESSAH